MTTDGHFSWPSAGSSVTAYGQVLVAAFTRALSSRDIGGQALACTCVPTERAERPRVLVQLWKGCSDCAPIVSTVYDDECHRKQGVAFMDVTR